MTGEGGRIARAGDYVFGLMNDRERERAERDLEIDPAFREAVLSLAARMHAFDRIGMTEGDAGERWRQVARHIDGLPQMQGVPAGADGNERAPVGSAQVRPRPRDIGTRAGPDRRALAVAFALIAAFALGYLAAKL